MSGDSIRGGRKDWRGYWGRLVGSVGGERIIVGLGGIYVGVGTARAAFVLATGRPFIAAIVDFLLVGIPGLVVLYGGLQLPRTTIDSDTYPRIVAWCLVGFLVVLAGIELLNLEPGVDIAYPRWSFTLGSAFGVAAGFAIGANDARAATQTRKVERKNQTLRRQNDRLDSFARMVAHELKNPLAIAQIYLDRVADGDPNALAEVRTALDRIEEMVEVVLVTARGTDAGIDRETVSLDRVAEEAWADLRVESADLVVETEQTVSADPIHVRHLLENLFKNAVEHSDGPVTVRLGSLPTGFYVADDGPGIPDNEQETVFEAGYTTDHDGIGMGLTFVVQLAEAYDWDCAVTSSATGGARFEFTDVDEVGSEDREQTVSTP